MKPDILYCNGDSWTYGDELEDKSDCYVNLIANEYKLELYNNALNGGSNQRIIRKTVHDIIKLKSEGRSPFALIAWTMPHRFELYSISKGKFVNFVGPEMADNIPLGQKIWSEYSSDPSDIEIFLTQVITLQSFLKQNDVPYLMTNVFKIMYECIKESDLRLYQSQIDTDHYIYNLPYKSLLTPYINVEWGRGGHPLKDGHQVLAEFLIKQLNIRHTLI